MPQSGAGISRSGGMCSSARRIRPATISGVSGVRVAHADDAKDDGLVAEAVERGEIEVGLRRLDRDLLGDRAGQFRQKRVAARLVAGDIGIAEAKMQRRRPGNTVEGPVDRRQCQAPRLFGTGLHPRLVELDHIGPGGLQIAGLGIDRRGVIHHQLFLVFVVFVLGLARHRERAGQGDLDLAIGVAAQELDIAHFDRPQPADRADDARHDNGSARPPADSRRVVEVDPGECCRKAVRIAFAADLAVGDDVDAGAFHVADREHRRIVLRLFEKGAGTRQSSCARTRTGGKWVSLSRSISQSGCG